VEGGRFGRQKKRKEKIINGSRREGKEEAKNLSLGGRIKCWF
jgi:hypothetical protein